jgi:hypothetical protein
VDVVEVGSAAAIAVGDRVPLEKDAGRGGQPGQRLAREDRGGAKERGKDGFHFFFALAFFLPRLASATRIVVWVLRRQLGVDGLEPSVKTRAQRLRQRGLGGGQVLGLADVVRQVVELVAAVLVEMHEAEVRRCGRRCKASLRRDGNAGSARRSRRDRAWRRTSGAGRG